MAKVTIGIDNGTTGAVAIISDEDSVFFPTPVKEALHYTKSKKMLRMLDWHELSQEIRAFTEGAGNPRAFIERPFVNPKFFNSSMSGMSCYLATRQCLEMLSIGYETVDSGTWQRSLIPGFKGPELKKASRLKGMELYPKHTEFIMKHKDADGLLIAHHFHNM